MVSLFEFFEEGWDQLVDLFYSIGPENVILGLMLIGFFYLINKALLKVFKKEGEEGTEYSGTIAVVSFALSILITYFFNKTEAINSLHPDELFFYLGFTEGFLAIIIPLLLLFGIFMMVKKVGPVLPI